MSAKQVYTLYLRFETEASKSLPGRGKPLEFAGFDERWNALGGAEREKLLAMYQEGLNGPSDNELDAMCEGLPRQREKKRQPAIMKES